MSGRAMRVLGLAERELPDGYVPDELGMAIGSSASSVSRTRSTGRAGGYFVTAQRGHPDGHDHRATRPSRPPP